jgi:hypothetical protein
MATTHNYSGPRCQHFLCPFLPFSTSGFARKLLLLAANLTIAQPNQRPFACLCGDSSLLTERRDREGGSRGRASWKGAPLSSLGHGRWCGRRGRGLHRPGKLAFTARACKHPPSSAYASLNASLTSAALAGLRTAASTHTHAHTHYQRHALAQGVQVDSDGYGLVFSPASPSASPAGPHPASRAGRKITTSNIVPSINNYNTMAAERASMSRPVNRL